jgi:NAD(P)-dependent dehydrogenase (short-subunit alcohol dehydrogenase family)
MASVLITGCSVGIGYETALAFARAGYKVAATMRSPSRAPQLAAQAAKEQLPVTVIAMDVDDDASVTQGMAAAVAAIGPIDVLVNNAGIERKGSVEELPLAEFRAVMETNYFGVIRCIQAVIPSMRQRRTGCIINISSVSGDISSTPTAAYAASKFALEGLSEALAQEAKQFGIRVALVKPGIIDTAMARRISTDTARSAYLGGTRFAALFATVLTRPVPPSLVAAKVLEIAGSGTWTLRHPVGPDAEPFLAWRKSKSDEEWVNWGAMSDEEWFAAVEADFGIDARPAAARLGA